MSTDRPESSGPPMFDLTQSEAFNALASIGVKL